MPALVVRGGQTGSSRRATPSGYREPAPELAARDLRRFRPPADGRAAGPLQPGPWSSFLQLVIAPCEALETAVRVLRQHPASCTPAPATRTRRSRCAISSSVSATVELRGARRRSSPRRRREARRSARPWPASGATWPTIRPRVAPEKRPSVSRATSSPRPSPTIAAVTWSISRMPGPPAGPSLRMTTMSPASILPGLDRGEAVLLALEHPRRAGLALALGAGELDDGALGREVAAQDREPALGLERIGERAHDLLAVFLDRGGGLLADRPAADRDRVLVQDPGLGEAVEDQRHAAGAVEVGGDEAPAGLQVGEQRRRASRSARSRRSRARCRPRGRPRAGGGRRWSSRRRR